MRARWMRWPETKRGKIAAIVLGIAVVGGAGWLAWWSNDEIQAKRYLRMTNEYIEQEKKYHAD